jgi:hypothetical protein
MAKSYEKKQYYTAEGNLIVKPYRLSDLAAIFDVNRKTMRKWMDKYPEDLSRHEGKYFSVRQVEFCLDKFGLPGRIVLLPIINKQAA